LRPANEFAADRSPTGPAQRNDAGTARAGARSLLAVRDVSVVFGGIVALNGVSFDMHKARSSG